MLPIHEGTKRIDGDKRRLLARVLHQAGITARFIPLSAAQQSVWLAEELFPRTAFYHISLALDLAGTLNLAALRQAVESLVTRHDVLRTAFLKVADRVVQCVTPEASLPVELVDFRAHPAAEAERLARQSAIEHAGTPFDLSVAPLARVRLLRLTADRHVLLIAIHHLICDEWSVDILLRELVTLYEHQTSGAGSTLPEAPRYADFCRRQRTLATHPPADTLDRWRTLIAGSADPAFERATPPDLARPFEFSSARTTIPAATTDRLRTSVARQRASLFCGLLAAFHALLCHRTGEPRLRLASLSANREDPATQGLVGLVMNTIVVAADTSDDPPFAELVARVRLALLDAASPETPPFEVLVDTLGRADAIERRSFCPVLCAFQPRRDRRFVAAGLTISDFAHGAPLDAPREAPIGFSFVLVLTEEPHGIEVSVMYKTTIFEKGEVETLLSAYVELVEASVLDPDRPISTLLAARQPPAGL